MFLITIGMYSLLEMLPLFKKSLLKALITSENAECKPTSREWELREKLCEYGKKLVKTGLVQGTWGNLSIKLDDTYMLVTPSGLDYTRLTPADMVKVNISTLEYEGSLKPTSEKGLHAEVYKQRPDAREIGRASCRERV